MKLAHLRALLLQYRSASVTSEERENSLGWTWRREGGTGRGQNKKIWVYLPRILQPGKDVLHPPLWTFKYFNIKQMPLTYKEEKEIKIKV